MIFVDEYNNFWFVGFYHNLQREALAMSKLKIVKGEGQMCQEKSFLFEHNREVYEQLENYLSVDNKAIVVLGTGIGKTTTALEYLNNHQVRGLVICPQNAIRADWDKVDEYVDTITYSKFTKVYQDIDYSNYGAVICDEVHHVGADKWGAGIKHIIDNDLCKVIGLTATPDRTDKIDIVNNIFSGNICQGLDMLAGIKEGIVHPFTYVGAYYDTDGLKEGNENEERRKEDKEYDLLCGKLDLAINNTPSLNEIITSNMPEGDRKIIVFVSDIDSIPEAKQILKPIFPNLEHRSLHSGLSKEEIEENREWFKNTNEGLLYTINMASEGIHYIGVNTLIMFRRTCSNIVFTQQMGRISTLTKYENPNAIVFDLVNNAKTVGNFKMAIKELSKEYSPREIRDILREHSTNEKSNQIIVRDYTGDIVDVLEEMKRYDDDSWTEEEDSILREFYPTEGAKGCLKLLSKRTRGSILYRAMFLNIKVKWLNKKVICLETKEVFNSIKEASEHCNSDVQSCLSGRQNVAAGRHWALLEDYNLWERERQDEYFGNASLMRVKEIICLETKKIFKNAKEASKKIGCRNSDISACCRGVQKSVAGYHFAFLSDYNSWNKEKQDRFLGKEPLSKKIICLETKEMFDSAVDADKIFNIGSSCIRNCCRGAQSSVKGYHFAYVSDYISWDIQKQNEHFGKKRLPKIKKVRCAETGVIYKSANEAAVATGLNKGALYCVLNGKCKTAGGYHWEYVEEENEKLNKTEE